MNKNFAYYSFKIFLHVWLAKIPQIIYHTQIGKKFVIYVKNNFNSTT